MKDPADRLILPPEAQAARALHRAGVDIVEQALDAQARGESWLTMDMTLPDGTTQKPMDLLAVMARMLRDGYSLRQIRASVPMAASIQNHVLERAIVNVGLPELKRRIEAGEEPEETRVRLDLRPDDPRRPRLILPGGR